MYKRQPLTKQQRIRWFFYNFYETGMELDLLYIHMANEDLDNLVWYGEKIYIPKYADELIEII